MKFINEHKTLLGCDTEEQVFDYFLKNLKPSNTLWTYFVNWEKVLKNANKVEVCLNILNYVIGKNDFDEALTYVLTEHPEVAQVLPILLVARFPKKNQRQFVVLVDHSNLKLVYETIDFSKETLTKQDIKNYLTFVEKTGLKQIITSGKIKNLVDYVIGVEAGLDSNGRKNRGGQAMEMIVEAFVADLCKRKDYRYLAQANAAKIKHELNYIVPVDKSSRKYDFVIDTKDELIIIETNFYGGGGSKLKSTAGEYRNLHDVLGGKFKFLWITDGAGWLTTSRPLRETFSHNDYILNLTMLEAGIFDSLV